MSVCSVQKPYDNVIMMYFFFKKIAYEIYQVKYTHKKCNKETEMQRILIQFILKIPSISIIILNYPYV